MNSKLKNRYFKIVMIGCLFYMVLGISGCTKRTEAESVNISEEELIVEEEFTSNIETYVSRRENIVKNSTGGKVAEIVFESVVFSEEKYKFITADLEMEKEKFFDFYEDGFLESVSYGEASDYREGYFPYYCTSKVKSVNEKNNCVSVLTEEAWYVGGISQYSLVGYNYSIDTGEKISIQNFTALDTDIIMEKIKEGLEYQNITLDSVNKEALEAYANKDIPFYFDDNGIYVIFPQGDICDMAAGCIKITIVDY